MLVICALSQMQNGKDTLCDYLTQKLNNKCHIWTRAAFADKVKQVFCDNFGVDRAFVEKWKVIDECPPGFDMPVRKGLQFIGDGFRKIKGDIWIDLCFEDETPKCVSDGRYYNELIQVDERGGINILIGRTDKVNNDTNDSEAMMRPYVTWALENLGEFAIIKNVDTSSAPPLMNKFDLWVKNDGSVQELYDKIDEYVLPFIEEYFSLIDENFKKYGAVV